MTVKLLLKVKVFTGWVTFLITQKTRIPEAQYFLLVYNKDYAGSLTSNRRQPVPFLFYKTCTFHAHGLNDMNRKQLLPCLYFSL